MAEGSLPPGHGAAGPAPGEPGAAPGFFKQLLEAKATTAFVIAAAAILVMCWRDPGSPAVRDTLWGFPDAVAEKYGAYAYHYVRDSGEWWRFVSALFVPRAALDAFIYVWLFFQLGPALERTLGTTRFCVLYLSAGAGGIALGELLEPNLANVRTAGTIVAVYALLGGIPGMILGATGSLKRTLRDPGAQSAGFWLVLWLAISYFMFRGWNYWSLAGAALLGLFLAVGLATFSRKKAAGVLITLVPLAVAAACVFSVTQGKRWDWAEQALADRGRPSTRGQQPQPNATPSRPSAEETAELVQSFRARCTPYLDRFGPLPSGEGLDSDDFDSIGRWLRKMEELLLKDNDVTTELDDLRVRCLLLLARHHEAQQLAEQLLVVEPSAANRALAGVANYFRGGRNGLETGSRYLSDALDDDPQLEQRVPEVHYYLGAARYKLNDDPAAERAFAQFLQLVGDDPDAQPDYRAPLVEQAKVQLGR